MRSSLEDIEMLGPEGENNENEDENEDEGDEEAFLSDLEGESCNRITRLQLKVMDPKEEEEPNEEEDEDEDEDPSPLKTNERNSQLTVGYKGDRSYVVRGNSIGVFRHSNNDKVKYYATISKIATPKGKGIKPKQVCLIVFLITNIL
jgi:hypothetical protein